MGMAFTTDAFIDKFFDEKERFTVRTKLIEEDLKQMVKEEIIKGVYVKGFYYYHLGNADSEIQ